MCSYWAYCNEIKKCISNYLEVVIFFEIIKNTITCINTEKSIAYNFLLNVENNAKHTKFKCHDCKKRMENRYIPICIKIRKYRILVWHDVDDDNVGKLLDDISWISFCFHLIFYLSLLILSIDFMITFVLQIHDILKTWNGNKFDLQ